LVLVAHGPALRGDFLWDDDDYITENPTLREAGGLSSIWFEPTALPQYYPLVHTTFWIESRLWGFHPFGYHVVNLALHAVASILAWAVLRRLAVPGAWLAAALFAVHPVQVESVAWVTERKNVLSAVFAFLALLALLRYAPLDAARQAPAGGSKRVRAARAPAGGSKRDYALALLFFAAALFSKTVTATLPAAFLVLVWWKKGRVERRDVVAMLPFLVLGIAMGLSTAWLEKHHVGAKGEEFGLSFADRILIAGRALWFYLGKLAVPARLSFIYPRWTVSAADLVAWAYPIAALAVLGALWGLRRRLGRGPIAAALLFAGTLFPALGFFDVYPMRYSFVADHFQYLACLPVLALVPAAGARMLAAVQLRGVMPGRVAAGVLVAILAVVCFQRSSVFRDLEGVWRDTLAKNPQSWMARHNLAMILEDQGKIDAAIEEYRRALAIRADLSQTYMNLGLLLAGKGDFPGARNAFENAVRYEPAFPGAIVNLGNVLYQMGDRAGALEQFRNALAIDPHNPSAQRNIEILTRPAPPPSGRRP
jgi:tetratricopeptide (TPR) repeat protein